MYLWTTIDVYYDCCEVGILKELNIVCADYPFEKFLGSGSDSSTSGITTTELIEDILCKPPIVKL